MGHHTYIHTNRMRQPRLHCYVFGVCWCMLVMIIAAVHSQLKQHNNSTETDICHSNMRTQALAQQEDSNQRIVYARAAYAVDSHLRMYCVYDCVSHACRGNQLSPLSRARLHQL
jgi:hypothetical protein